MIRRYESNTDESFLQEFLIDAFLMIIGLAFLVAMVILFLKYTIPVDAL